MEEKKFVNVRKDEYNVKLFVKKMFGKGRISKVKIEYTPVGEKVIISTHKPGWIIGKKGEKINDLTRILKKRFNMENPHIDIDEILHPEFDAQLVADEIALTLERFGASKYKAVSYKLLSRIKKAGALGAELRVSGKLPSDRARVWRFNYGYLKKTGEPSNIVDKGESIAETKQGVIGIQVSILPPNVIIHDQFKIEDVINTINSNLKNEEETEKPIKLKTKKVKKE
jgi:small subunit ribosomal protein S3